jgi:hypothetical protein
MEFFRPITTRRHAGGSRSSLAAMAAWGRAPAGRHRHIFVTWFLP